MFLFFKKVYLNKLEKIVSNGKYNSVIKLFSLEYELNVNSFILNIVYSAVSLNNWIYGKFSKNFNGY